jgi:hypothetical protein
MAQGKQPDLIMETTLLRITLEEVKIDPAQRAHLLNIPAVRIWSGEHEAYWRAKLSGYTLDAEDAGVYSGVEAWENTSHCCPKKAISYELIS